MNEKDVDKELKKLKSVSAKLWAVKENIRIRVKGFGTADFSRVHFSTLTATKHNTFP